MKTIGLFMGTTEDSYGQELIQGAWGACQARGVRLLCVSSGALASSHGLEAQRNVLYEVVSPTSLDAVLFSGTLSHNVDQETLLAFCDRFAKMPRVSMAVRLPGMASVTTDPHESMRNLVDHMTTHHGMRDFAILGGPLGQQEAEERKSILLKRLAKHGIAVNPGLIVHGDFTYESGVSACKKLLASGQKFQAILSINDSMALGAMEVLKAAGLRVPEDVALTGFDDSIDGRFSRPAMTTIRQSVLQLAWAAASMAIDILEGKTKVLHQTVPTELIFRDSCTCPPPWFTSTCTNLNGCTDKEGPRPNAVTPDVEVLEEKVLTAWKKLDQNREHSVHEFIEQVWYWAESINPEEGDPAEAWSRLQAKLTASGSIDSWRFRVVLQAGIQVLDSFVKRNLQIQVGLNSVGDRIRNVREALLATFSLPDVLDVLARDLPLIGYRGAWLSLFEDSRKPAHLAKLVLGLDPPPSKAGADIPPTRRTLSSQGASFESHELLPQGLASLGQQAGLMVLEALYSRDVHLGFILFDSSLLLTRYTGTLRTQISGAIYGSLLLDQKDKAMDQLVEAEKSVTLGNLVAGIAHEVNTPLGVALSAASYLMGRYQELKTQYQEGQLKRSDLETWIDNTGESGAIISTNLDRAAHLIASFKQVSVDQASEQRRSFKLMDYLGEIVTSLRPYLRRHREITIDLQGHKDLVMDSFPGAISQVVSNLIINALSHAFAPGQSGTLTITVAPYTAPDAELFAAGVDQVSITCTDNGKGMSPDVLERIFEPFYTTRREQGGTGLGLPIVKRLVTGILAGSISCNSQPGLGTSFTLVVPLQSPVPKGVAP